MNWNDKKSIALTKLVVGIVAAVLTVILGYYVMFSDNVIVKALYSAIYNKALNTMMFTTTMFTTTIVLCIVVGYWILYVLLQLLRNIQKEETFSQKSIESLRRLSWVCFLECGIFLLSAIYYWPWIIIAAIAAFIGLIIRVIKNVFCQALYIKEENDFTI